MSMFLSTICILSCSTAQISVITPETDMSSCGLAPESAPLCQFGVENTLLDTDTIGYGYVAYDPIGAYAGTCYFALDSPGTITPLNTQASDFIATADFAEGTLYGIVFGGTLVTVDTDDGTVSVIGGTINATGMTYDQTTDTMYVVDFDGKLYTLDITDGSTTFVENTQSNLIALECSNDGTLYGIEIQYDTVGTIKKDTGAWTEVGSIGMDLNYAQDASFDHETGTLYHAAYDSSASQGKLVTIDLATGASTLIGSFQNGIEMTGFAIPSDVNADPVAEFSYAPQMPKTGQTISFDPSASYDTDGTIESYEWDWDSDGTYDATGATASHYYLTAGKHMVTLKVTDDKGATATFSDTITVAPQASPVVAFIPMKNTLLAQVNAMYEDIQARLPDEVPDDISGLLGQVEAHIHNASGSANSIHAMGELRKAQALLEEISSSL